MCALFFTSVSLVKHHHYFRKWQGAFITKLAVNHYPALGDILGSPGPNEFTDTTTVPIAACMRKFNIIFSLCFCDSVNYRVHDSAEYTNRHFVQSIHSASKPTMILGVFLPFIGLIILNPKPSADYDTHPFSKAIFWTFSSQMTMANLQYVCGEFIFPFYWKQTLLERFCLCIWTLIQNCVI